MPGSPNQTHAGAENEVDFATQITVEIKAPASPEPAAEDRKPRRIQVHLTEREFNYYQALTRRFAAPAVLGRAFGALVTRLSHVVHGRTAANTSEMLPESTRTVLDRAYGIVDRLRRTTLDYAELREAYYDNYPKARFVEGPEDRGLLRHDVRQHEDNYGSVMRREQGRVLAASSIIQIVLARFLFDTERAPEIIAGFLEQEPNVLHAKEPSFAPTSSRQSRPENLKLDAKKLMRVIEKWEAHKKVCDDDRGVRELLGASNDVRASYGGWKLHQARFRENELEEALEYLKPVSVEDVATATASPPKTEAGEDLRTLSVEFAARLTGLGTSLFREAKEDLRRAAKNRPA